MQNQGQGFRKYRAAMVGVLLAAGLVALAAGLFRLSAPVTRAGEMHPMLPDEVRVALTGNNRVTSTENGKLTWTMQSRGLDYFEERGEVRVQEPRATVPLTEGGTVEVGGKTGIYYQARQDIGLHQEVTIILTRNGRREWVLFGDTASYRKGEEAFYIGGLKGAVYQEQGDSVGIQGARGRYDIKARAMRLQGNVICRWSNGVTLATDHVDYETATSIARTEAPVLITGQGFKLTGQGLTANLKTQEMVIPAQVDVVIQQGVAGKNKPAIDGVAPGKALPPKKHGKTINK